MLLTINHKGYISADTVRNAYDNCCRIAVGYIVNIDYDLRNYFFHIESCHVGNIVVRPVTWESYGHIVFADSQVYKLEYCCAVIDYCGIVPVIYIYVDYSSSVISECDIDYLLLIVRNVCDAYCECCVVFAYGEVGVTAVCLQ